MFGYVPADNLRWAEWVNMVPVNGRPILIGFNGGRVAVDVESWSDREIVQSALTVLRKMFGADLPDPVSHMITRWQADPWSLGSYSHLPPGSTPDDRRVLAEPVEGRVFFAGEACSIEHAATVHGAYLSGVKAAEEILAQTRG
jgi:monoamine oxidase